METINTITQTFQEILAFFISEKLWTYLGMPDHILHLLVVGTALLYSS